MKDKAEYLRKIYTQYLRSSQKNEWIQIKKDDKALFDTLAATLYEKEMDFHDYVDYHFSHSKYVSTKWITSPKAIEKYDYHRKLKNKYVTDDYRVDGDKFYVNKTYKEYDYRQVMGPTSQDPDANYALVSAEQDSCTISKDLEEAVEYTICKFKLKGKTIPETLKRLKDEIETNSQRR